MDRTDGTKTGKRAKRLTGALRGEIDARDFEVVNEPRLKSLVSSRPAAEKPSLSEAVKQDIDTSVVKFERGYSQITKGRGLLKLDNGILRGPLVQRCQHVQVDRQNATSNPGDAVTSAPCGG